MASSAELFLLLKGKDQGASSLLHKLGGPGGALPMLGIAAAATGAALVTGLAAGFGAAVKSGLDMSSELENTRARLVAFTKDGAEADRILGEIRQEANLTPFAFREMAAATAALMPTAKASNTELMALVKTAEILAASNPAQGLEGAAFALREAVSGDFVSVIERFDLPRTRLNELKAQGVPALEAIKIAMKEMGLDADLVAGMAETMTGRWSTFMDSIDTLKTKLAAPLFEAMKDSLEGAQGWIEGSTGSLEKLADVVGTGLAKAFGGVGSIVGPAASAVTAFLGILDGARGPLEAVAAVLRQTFGEGVAGGFERFTSLAADLANRLDIAFKMVGIAVEKLFAGDLPRATEIGLKALDFATGGIRSALSDWASHFVEWVAFALPPMLDRLGELGKALLAWIGDQLPGLGAKLFEWAGAYWGWVNEARLRLIGELGPLVAGLYKWIGEQAPPILKTFISEWVPAFIEWVAGTALPELVKALAGLVVAIFKFVVEVGPEIVKAWTAIGAAVVEGILLGIGNLAGKLMARMKEMATDALNAVRNALPGGAPSSPWPAFAKLVGEPIVEGIIKGILEKKPALMAEMFKLAQEALAAAGEGNAAMGELSDFVFAEAAARPGRAIKAKLDTFFGEIYNVSMARDWGQMFGPVGARLMEAIFEGTPQAMARETDALMQAMRKGLPPEKAADLSTKLMQAMHTVLATGGQDAKDVLAAVLTEIQQLLVAAVPGVQAAAAQVGAAALSGMEIVAAAVKARGGGPILTGFHGAGSAAPTYYTPQKPFYDPASGTYHAAAGGIFNQPTMALIGEAGPEAVIPLNRAGGIGGGGGVTINFNGPTYGMDDFYEKVDQGILEGRIRQVGR